MITVSPSENLLPSTIAALLLILAPWIAWADTAPTAPGVAGVRLEVQRLEVASVDEMVDQLLQASRSKFSPSMYADRMAEFGEAAVPTLIERYPEGNDLARSAMVACLSRTPTPEARAFLRGLLQANEDRRAVNQVILSYPEDFELEIAPLLIEHLGKSSIAYRCSERLRKMIFRRPEVAGKLVEALSDEASAKERNRDIRDILQFVSGYAHTGLSDRYPEAGVEWSTANQFWRVWWERNQDKDPFEWQLESLYFKNGTMRSYPLQIMGVIGDERAIPVYLTALDDEDFGVRYWAAIGLKKFRGDYPEGGYLAETFREGEAEIIADLKAHFAGRGE